VQESGEQLSSSLDGLGASIFDFVIKAAADFWNLANEAVASFLDWISKGGAMIWTFIEEIGIAVSGWIQARINDFLKWANEVIASVSKWVNDTKELIVEWITDRLADISNFVSSAIDEFSRFVSETWDAIVKWGTDLYNKIAEAMSNIWAEICGTFGKLIDEAFQFGRNFIDSIIRGIRSLMGQLASIAQQAADLIRQYLGIASEAQRGPLSRLEEWPRNLVRTYAEEMRRAVPMVQAASARVAQAAQTATYNYGNIYIAFPNVTGPVDRETIRRIREEIAKEFRTLSRR